MNGQKNIGFSITSDYTSIRDKEVFSDLLRVLMAFAYNLIGNSTTRLAKNKSDLAYDFSMEAINRYLENPSKFDPSRNPDLVKYLKYYVLRQIISNHKSLKGQQNELLYEKNDLVGISVEKKSLEQIDIHDSLDLKNCIKLIRREIKDTKELEELFELRYIKDHSRAEIIEELNLSQGEYNNRI